MKIFPGLKISEEPVEVTNVLLDQNKVEVRKGESWKNIYQQVEDAWKKLIKEKLEITQKGELSLSFYGIKIPSFPSNIGSLIPQNIHYIGIVDNPLTSLPPSMARLTGLKSLLIIKTNLEALPNWLSDFTELELLNIQDNPLDPASVIEYLKSAPEKVAVLISASKLDEMKELDSYQFVKEFCEVRPYLTGSFNITKKPQEHHEH